jgi:galacturan 1,4-alpha-galacturonidase
LFYVENATNVEVSEINFLHSPAWFTFIVNARNVSFDRCTFYAKSLSKARPKNTDGFDTYNVDGFRLTNSRLTVDDDCFSAKPNTTNVLVENVWCDGSHGVSMGSIGQYPGVLDYISNVMVRNVTLLNGQNGARLKAWAGKDKGYGYIKNITFQDLAIENTDQPIVLDQCYFNVKGKECLKYPSKVNISDIKFINIHGTSSAKRGCVVGSLKCSPAAECKNIELQNIDLRSPLEEDNDEEAKPTGKGAKGKIICDGIVGPRGLGVDCVSSSAAGC